jgi:signal transduction histidine kinase
MCNDLRPVYQDVALVQTLSWSLQKLNQISANTTIDLLVLAEEPASLSRDVRCTCQQVAEQAVHNALLHAAASRILAEITFPDALNSRAGITLCVTDDGIGFEPRSPLYWRSTQHHGLANMYESAALIGGTLNIESALGQGTRVSLWLPPMPHSIEPIPHTSSQPW